MLSMHDFIELDKGAKQSMGQSGRDKVLKEFDEMLSDYGFFRIHRTHLVNLNHIKRFAKQDGGFVMMTNNDMIPVSSRSRERLLKLFDEL